MPIPGAYIESPEWSASYGPTDGIGMTIGDTLLHAWYSDADEHGVKWGLTQLDGWFDGWEGVGAVEQRSHQDGAWVSPQYASARLLSVGGSVESYSWDAVTQAWDRLLAQIPFRTLSPVSVTTGEGSVPEMTALVRQSGKPILFERRAGRAKFSLSLVAPDPRRYAATSRSATLVLPLLSGGIAPPLTPPLTVTGSTTVSQATLANDGTVLTYPILELAGPCPPARIVNLTTGEALRVVDPVPAGQILVIDVQRGIATTGGQSRRVLGSWWGLAPGANEVAFYADGYDAAATLDISYRSAWK